MSPGLEAPERYRSGHPIAGAVQSLPPASPGFAHASDFLILLLFLTCLPAFAAAPSVQELVDRFDTGNYFDLLSNKLYARQGMNRLAVTGSEHDLCRDAVYAQFIAAGLSPTLDCFTFQDSNNVQRTACNIVAIKRGVQNPQDEIFVAGAHYDSKNNAGADDNATGVACLLEMARLFSPHTFRKTIVFVAFDGEEIWDFGGIHRLGSVHYVDRHGADNIQAMVSVDMIGWQSTSTPNTAWMYGRPSSFPVTNELATAIRTYGGLSAVPRLASPEISDHVAFADAGFPACLLIEAGFSGNPNYHRVGDFIDQPGYIDWAYVEKMCKSAVGYFATKLQPADTTPAVVSMSRTGAGRTIDFSGLPGCQYATELSPTLSSPDWTPIATNTAAADGAFSTTDTRVAQTAGFYRARFVVGASSTRPPVIVVDNRAATVSGNWSTGTSSIDKYGPNYRFASPGTGQDYVEFRPQIAVAGNYAVYEWHPQGANRTTDALTEVVCATGTQNTRINQQQNGGTWVLIGTFPFNAGTAGCVRISNGFVTGSVAMADAIKFVCAP